MRVRSTRWRNLAVILAVLASLVALGCWDSRREMARVLDDGYATTAQLLGAQFQRSAPFAVDGWRPRFVEQSLSVDLQWTGKDGKARIHRKVPVSAGFERSVVSGEQVRLMSVPVKVLDDETSVPVLTLDAAARLESLQTWLSVSGSIALVAWAIVAVTSFWRRRAVRTPVAQRATIASAAPAQPVEIPIQRLMIGIVAFGMGAFLSYSATTVASADGIKGTDVTAEINAIAGPPYTVHLGWRDGLGGVHRFGPLAVSDTYWNKITRDGKLEVRTARVRVPFEGVMAPPLILDDLPADRWETKAALAGGIVSLILGAGCLLSAGRALRRRQGSSWKRV